MQNTTALNLPGRKKPVYAWLDVDDPTETGGEEVIRLSLDVPAKDIEFLERVAAYRNALAKEQGKRLRQQWSRKSLAEAWLTAQCAAARSQFRDMLEGVGEIPPASDEDAVARFVKRVLVWSRRRSGNE